MFGGESGNEKSSTGAKRSKKGPCTVCGWSGLVPVAQMKCKQIQNNKMCAGYLNGDESNRKKKKKATQAEESSNVEFSNHNSLHKALKNMLAPKIKSAIRHFSQMSSNNYWFKFQDRCEDWEVEDVTGTSASQSQLFDLSTEYMMIYRLKLSEESERVELDKDEKSLNIVFNYNTMIAKIIGEDSENDFFEAPEIKFLIGMQIGFNPELVCL